MTGPDTESVLSAYAAVLEKLEPLCTPPPTRSTEHLLWFAPEEVSAVNGVWRSQGILAVTDAWGDARRVDANYPLGGDDRVYLLVNQISPPGEIDRKQFNYFRQCVLETPPSLGSELLEALHSTGLYETLVPEQESISGHLIRSAPVRSVECEASWYGPENLYGEGTELRVNITLSVSPDAEVSLRISLIKGGHIHSCLFDPKLYETGYEGHDHKVAPMSVSAMRGLLPALVKVSELKPRNPVGLTVGMWRGDL